MSPQDFPVINLTASRSTVAQLVQRFQTTFIDSEGFATTNTTVSDPPSVSVSKPVQRFQPAAIDDHVPARLYAWRGETLDFNRLRTIGAVPARCIRTPAAHCQPVTDVIEMPVPTSASLPTRADHLGVNVATADPFVIPKVQVCREPVSTEPSSTDDAPPALSTRIRTPKALPRYLQYPSSAKYQSKRKCNRELRQAAELQPSLPTRSEPQSAIASPVATRQVPARYMAFESSSAWLARRQDCCERRVKLQTTSARSIASRA